MTDEEIGFLDLTTQKSDRMHYVHDVLTLVSGLQHHGLDITGVVGQSGSREAWCITPQKGD
jgi:hypothetical protein